MRFLPRGALTTKADVFVCPRGQTSKKRQKVTKPLPPLSLWVRSVRGITWAWSLARRHAHMFPQPEVPSFGVGVPGFAAPRHQFLWDPADADAGATREQGATRGPYV